MAIASSLLQAIKNVAKHANLVRISMRFSQGSIPESFVKTNLKLTHGFNKHRITLSIFIYFLFSGINPCKKRTDILGWYA